MVSDVQIRLSGGTEKLLGKYRAALTEVFDSLSVDDQQHCEELANEWNHSQLPEDVQRRFVGIHSMKLLCSLNS